MKGTWAERRTCDLARFGRARTAFPPPFTSVTRVQIPSGTPRILLDSREQARGLVFGLSTYPAQANITGCVVRVTRDRERAVALAEGGGCECYTYRAFAPRADCRATSTYHREIVARNDARKRDGRGLALIRDRDLLRLAARAESEHNLAEFESVRRDHQLDRNRSRSGSGRRS